MIFLLLILIFPLGVTAQSVNMSAGKVSYAVGESILVTVSIQTGGQSINTIGGNVTFSPGDVVVSNLRYGNSIISLWVDKPSVSGGTIKFTGGVPGGYNGSYGPLFSFVAVAKTVGQINFNLNDVHVLANDGSGAEIQGVKTPSLNINISKQKIQTPSTNPIPSTNIEVPKKETSVLPPDVIAPETFIPLIGHHPSIADDAYFVSFFSVDKDSGIEKYEVSETPAGLSIFGRRFSTPWQEATSPYVLKFQKWGSVVSVKAIDQAGNIAISEVSKPISMEIFTIIIVLLVLFTVFITRFFTVHRILRHKKKI